jgi:dTDP-4-amino-4,6-dideoxygalactose transaminase
MLAINDPSFIKRAEIIWEKGTNRTEFFRGEVNKYDWVDIGSSFLPTEIVSAFLWAQLESLETIQKKRLELWDKYHNKLSEWALNNNISLPNTPSYGTNNGHMFYLVCKNGTQRKEIIDHLGKHDILAVFHYLSLHKSPYYSHKHDKRALNQADRFSECLVRLPLFHNLQDEELNEVCEVLTSLSF